MKKQKKKAKKTGFSDHLKRDIISVVILAISVLVFFSVSFKQGTVGPAGDLISESFHGLFGRFLSFIIPITLIIYSFLILINKIHPSNRTMILKILLLYIIFSAMINVSISSRITSDDFFGKINEYYDLGQEGKGGGAFSAVISIPLTEYLKAIGALTILSALAIIDLVIITGISLSESFGKFIAFIIKPFRKKTGSRSYEKKLAPVKRPRKEKDDLKRNRKRFNLDELRMEEDKPVQKTIAVKKIPPKSPVEDTGPRPYAKPPLHLLKSSGSEKISNQDLRKSALERANILIETLKSFNVEAEIVNISIGPNVTQYELTPKRGVKVSKIVNLSDDIALNLAAADVRIEAPIPGKAAIGIEVPNERVDTVHLKDIIESREFTQSSSKLTFALGKDISGNPVTADIARMPHLLIAGATGSGKSVCINNLILSILFNTTPEEVRMILIDPKVVELKIYDGIPQLLVPVVTDPRKAAGALVWAVSEMNRRYVLFADNNAKDFKTYNRTAELYNNGNRQDQKEMLPLIVIIIDELADLMAVAPNEVEDSICRLAQMARAAGIHLVLATQRPSVNVITGLIKANIPSRISFAVSAQVDSRTILDMGGAEKLIGKGDMLYLPIGMQKPKRLQGAFVSDKEVEAVVEYLKARKKADYDDEVFEIIEKGDLSRSKDQEKNDIDELLSEAIKIVVETGNASASLLQRKLKVGYARAGRLIDQMAEREIVGPYAGSKPRDVLLTKEEFYEMEMKKKKHGGE